MLLLINEDGSSKPQTSSYNSSADISPTAGQMPRALGLALASKLYRNNPFLGKYTDFSNQGNEVCFCTIGNASTSEGGFWETVNAACVLQVPLAVSIWDDEYGISVHAKYQTAKENLSAILKGFQTDATGKGLELYTVKGWDYQEMVLTYRKAIKKCREEHTPVIVHVTEITQPQGHSTSGSHERYKSKERLEWEKEYDCIAKMREWMMQNNIISELELEELETAWKREVTNIKKEAFDAFMAPIVSDKNDAVQLIRAIADQTGSDEIVSVCENLESMKEAARKDIAESIHKTLRLSIGDNSVERAALQAWFEEFKSANEERYSSNLHSGSALDVQIISPEFASEAKMMDGREVLQACFDAALERDPRVFAFGEDVGKIGDVNQGFAGLQEKYGELRVTDKGIRELTIIGEGIGAAMRGLRPIAEIQYLDYLLYAVQILSDNLATLQWRTMGGQKSPLIIRTRGHRLEGIWHSGSPMGMIINALRGMYAFRAT